MSLINQEYVKLLFQELKTHEYPSNYYFSLQGERSCFLRVNKSKLRQATHVDQSNLSVCIKNTEDENLLNVQLTGSLKEDVRRVNAILDENVEPLEINAEAASGDIDDQKIIKHKSRETDFLEILDDGDDLVGIFTDGELFSGVARGGDEKLQWFETARADVDYSIYEKDSCIKEFFSLGHLSREKIAEAIIKSKENMSVLQGEKIELKPGVYPAYFSPSAVNEMLGMFNWHGVQGKAFAEKQSVFMELFEQKKSFHPAFNLRENFALNLSPKFNEEGEVSEEMIDIIKEGQLVSPLVNSTSAKKYKMNANKANRSETLRSAELVAGKTSESELISSMYQGLYISDLHYLNWSNKKNASITGMTRYGCYFIDEEGHRMPIKDMRFNMSLYDVFGAWLTEFSSESKVFSDSHTYGSRSLVGAKVPGVLSSINFTL